MRTTRCARPGEQEQSESRRDAKGGRDLAPRRGALDQHGSYYDRVHEFRMRDRRFLRRLLCECWQQDPGLCQSRLGQSETTIDWNLLPPLCRPDNVGDRSTAILGDKSENEKTDRRREQLQGRGHPGQRRRVLAFRRRVHPRLERVRAGLPV